MLFRTVTILAQKDSEQNNVCPVSNHNRVEQFFHPYLDYNTYPYSRKINRDINCKALFEICRKGVVCEYGGQISEICIRYHVFNDKICAKNDYNTSCFIIYYAVFISQDIPQCCSNNDTDPYNGKPISESPGYRNYCFSSAFLTRGAKYTSLHNGVIIIHVLVNYSRTSGVQELYSVYGYHNTVCTERSKVASSVVNLIRKALTS